MLASPFVANLPDSRHWGPPLISRYPKDSTSNPFFVVAGFRVVILLSEAVIVYDRWSDRIVP